MWAQIDFNEDGPHIGGVRLLRKSSFGFRPPTREELSALASCADAIGLDVDRFSAALTFIADAMNKGDFGLAAVAAGRLRVPDKLRSVIEAGGLVKASADDPKHPGYPAGAPDGKGGQFRPKKQVASAERSERLKRLAQRKTFRSIARRILSVRRVLKTLGLYVESAVVEEMPIVNDAVGAVSMAIDIDLLMEYAEDVADSDAAIDFVNKGPVELKELQRSPDEEQSFSSFDAFKKIDLEKRFGPAGEGYDYHHIVEQGPNAGVFTQEQLQSTDNIVRIPRLLHEEVNSAYGRSRLIGSEFTTPRAYLRGRSFEEQREFGIDQLRKIGILH